MLLAQLKAQLVLKHMIIDAQKNDVELQKKTQLVKDGGKTNYLMGEDGGLFYKNRLCVPNVQELKRKLMYESHNTLFTMHPRGNKMYHDFLVARDKKRI